MQSASKTTKGAETKQRIVAAATDLFAEQGFHATSITDIGERSGVQRGALYYHIDSKGELLFAVLMGHAESMLEGVGQIAALDLEPRAKLQRLLDYHAESLLHRRAELTVYERDRSALDDDRAGELRAVQDRIEAVWAAILAEGAAAGHLRAVDPVVLKGIISMVNGVHRWYRPKGRLTSADINERLSEFVLRGLDPG